MNTDELTKLLGKAEGDDLTTSARAYIELGDHALDLAREVIALRAQRARKDEALRHAESVFYDYALLHQSKGTAVGKVRAAADRKHRDKMREALTPVTGDKDKPDVAS